MQAPIRIFQCSVVFTLLLKISDLANVKDSTAVSSPPTPTTIVYSSNSSKNDGELGTNGTKYEIVKEEPQAETVTDSEVEELLDVKNKSNIRTIYVFHPYNSSGYPKDDAEYIENGENTEDEWKHHSNENPSEPIVVRQRSMNLTFINQGQLAGIFAVVFLLVAIVGFLSLLSWRNYLEKRYGNRVMLDNEEFKHDDMRHFSL